MAIGISAKRGGGSVKSINVWSYTPSAHIRTQVEVENIGYTKISNEGGYSVSASFSNNRSWNTSTAITINSRATADIPTGYTYILFRSTNSDYAINVLLS